MESLPTSPASFEEPGGDKSGKEYWDRGWETNPLLPPIDPYRRDLKNYARDFVREKK